MVGLFCDVLVNHSVAVVLISASEVYCLHEIAVVANCQFKVFTLLCEVGDTEREHVLHFEVLNQLLGRKEFNSVDLHLTVCVLFNLHLKHANSTRLISNEKFRVDIMLADVKRSN